MKNPFKHAISIAVISLVLGVLFLGIPLLDADNECSGSPQIGTCTGTAGVYVCDPGGEGCQNDGSGASSDCTIFISEIPVCMPVLPGPNYCPECSNSVTYDVGSTYAFSFPDCMGEPTVEVQYYDCGCN